MIQLYIQPKFTCFASIIPVLNHYSMFVCCHTFYIKLYRISFFQSSHLIMHTCPLILYKHTEVRIPIRNKHSGTFLQELELTMVRSRDLMSMAESLSAMLPPVQSIISTRNTSPSVTSATGGMWGCQRLCRGYFCSHGFFLRSMGTTNLGLGGAITELVWLYWTMSV